MRGVRRTIAQAVALAGEGAVHLNARVRKPLEPCAPPDSEREASTRIRAAAATPLVRFDLGARVASGSLDALRVRIAEEPRGVIAVGPMTRHDAQLDEALAELSARSGYPLLTEPTSQVRTGLAGALSTVFASDAGRAALQPRVVLQVGPPPVAASWERMIADAAHVEIFASHAEVDAESRAHAVHVGNPLERVRALTAALPAPTHREHGALVAEAHARVGRALLAALEPTDELASVVAIARAARSATLFVGNSLPVRELAAAAALGAPTLAHHQRGASGIDGLCAGAAGIASTGTPTVLLLGDVSLLHDLHGLWLAGQSKTPLVVAVVCNGGGRIFDTLPIGRRADLASALPLFDTPVSPDLASLARFCGMTHVRTTHAEEVEPAVAAALGRGGATLLELVVAADSAARWSVALSARVDAAMKGASS